MPRISYVDPATVTDQEFTRYFEDSRRYGTPRLESQAIRAHVPAVLRSFNEAWQTTFREGVLDHSIKELARVFIAKTLNCEYCAGQRSHLAAEQGLTERVYDEVLDFRKFTLLGDREKAALLWAEAIAWDPAMADDAVWEQLHCHFSEPELVELGFFIGLTMGQQKLLKTLDIKHGDLGADSLAVLAPDVADSMSAATGA